MKVSNGNEMNCRLVTLSLQGRLKVKKKSVTNHVYIVPSESFTLIVLILGEIRLHAWSESCQSRFLLGHNQIAPPGWAVGCLEKSKNLFSIKRELFLMWVGILRKGV